MTPREFKIAVGVLVVLVGVVLASVLLGVAAEYWPRKKPYANLRMLSNALSIYEARKVSKVWEILRQPRLL